jgi:hypothetical protein
MKSLRSDAMACVLYLMRRIWPVVVLAACGGGQKKQQAAAELPAEKVGDVAGTWVASDDMDWGYKMTITAPSTIDVWIDRGKMGRCEQKGTLKPSSPRVFQVTYTRGECNPQAVNVPIDMSIASFTGSSLTVVVGDQKRVYTRAPQ